MGKWDFDDDEVVFFLIASIVGIVGLGRWYFKLVFRSQLSRCGGVRLWLAITPVISLLGLFFVLTHWADPAQVVGHFDYQLMFFTGGMAWLAVVGAFMPLLGISIWDDAVERSNPAAASAVCGAMLGAMAIYAGGNVGAGPTIWTTVLPAIVATGAWLFAWLLVEVLSGASEAITVDRDLATGLRHAGFLIASGLILARAVAGDWTSWESTYSEMLHLGWPAAALAVAAILAGRMLRPSINMPRPGVTSAGLFPAIAFVGLATAYLAVLGPAEIGKHIITYEQYMQSR